jgi:hypothetical protein
VLKLNGKSTLLGATSSLGTPYTETEEGATLTELLDLIIDFY